LGFLEKRTTGSHAQWEKAADANRLRSIVTVDMSASQFDDFLMQSMIRQF